MPSLIPAFPTRCLRTGIGSALVLIGLASASAATVVAPNFNDEVLPILVQHCTKCHGGVKQAGGVSFIYRDQVLSGGKSGHPAVVPGDTGGSELFRRVTTTDPDDRMPPVEESPKGLASSEIDILRRWIVTGAAWDGHWAYRVPVASVPPVVSHPDWSRQPLDPFILARLEQEGLSPAPPADPAIWLRRAALDATGLPPSLEEMDAFLAELRESGEKAFESAVDRLLASPHYGERWASVWLDQVRYADSRGLGLDGRRSIWKYRDWVIDAYNRDLPYDDFTIRQIAGDLLPDATLEDRIATACHRNTQANNEGGTDDEEFRVMAVLDRVSTTWQAWQATSFGCVQCHHHPYDPFRHDEFYAFAAFFNNSVDSDLQNDEPLMEVPLKSADYERAGGLDRRIAALKESLWRRGDELRRDPGVWRSVAGMKASTAKGTPVKVREMEGRPEFFMPVGVNAREQLRLEVEIPANQGPLTALQLTGLPVNPDVARKDSEWGFVVTKLKVERLPAGASDKPQILEFQLAIPDEPHPLQDPMDSFRKGNTGFSAYSRIHFPRAAVFIPAEPVALEPGDRLRLTLDHGVFALGAFPLVMRRGQVEISDDPRWTALVRDPDLQVRRQQLADWQAERKKIPSVNLPIMEDRPERFTRPTHLFIRGNFLEKDKLVTPATPESLPALQARGEPNRLHLARWLASPRNPLTARVEVNRIWAQLFGVGLVPTLEDFGSAGAQPTHPALLDTLAARFQTELGWSRKNLLREFLLSATYRQSSRCGETLRERDPDNRLLGRGPRMRLSAEMVRDQALAVSGLLDRTLHGPPVHPPIPDGVWKPFARDEWKTDKDGDRFRRSVYTYMKRSIPYPSFATFDAPSREFCTPRRLTSNTPLQALVTLNDEVFVECAEAFGRRLTEAPGTPSERLGRGYRLATGRRPDAERVGELTRLLTETREALPDTVGKGGEQAAYNVVAGVLLNLDEVLSK